jgi:hypothetical protein
MGPTRCTHMPSKIIHAPPHARMHACCGSDGDPCHPRPVHIVAKCPPAVHGTAGHALHMQTARHPYTHTSFQRYWPDEKRLPHEFHIQVEGEFNVMHVGGVHGPGCEQQQGASVSTVPLPECHCRLLHMHTACEANAGAAGLTDAGNMPACRPASHHCHASCRVRHRSPPGGGPHAGQSQR